MEYIIQDTTLTGLADAIRAKTGKTDQLTPAQMAAEVESLEVGGGDTEVEDGLIARTVTSYSNSRVDKVGDYAFAGCAALITIDMPRVTNIGLRSFYSCGGLTSAEFPDVTKVGDNAFSECISLAAVDFPVATRLVGSSFYKCVALRAVRFPLLTDIGVYSFNSCSGLVSAEFPVATAINPSAFISCSSLIALILRREDVICRLTNINAFNGTPIASGAGYIYVPDALVDGYKAATNWATYADQIKPLSELPEEG